jgi:hypothetical protein
MDGTSYSHCQSCLAEYREGFDTCADCGIPLVRGSAPATEVHALEHTKGHRHPTNDRNEVPVILCQVQPIEAQVLVASLQAAGLVAAADEPSLWSPYGVAISMSTGLRVWVLESQLEEARKIEKRARSGDDAI